ncbi:MAG: hypothetical protein ACRC6E_00710 [Fusobacteriaceae bacterium]
MKNENLRDLKNEYNFGDKLYLTSKNYIWVVTKEEFGYRLRVKQRDMSDSNLNHLEGLYSDIDFLEKSIFERVLEFEFITF